MTHRGLLGLSDAALARLQSLKREIGNPLLFPSRPCPAPQFAHQHWDTIRCRAGLPDIRLHDLWPSFASMLVNSGESLYVVQDLLGHSSPHDAALRPCRPRHAAARRRRRPHSWHGTKRARGWRARVSCRRQSRTSDCTLQNILPGLPIGQSGILTI